MTSFDAGRPPPGQESLVIAIAGAVGSGKSTITRALAAILGMERHSTGEFHRMVARDLGISTLQLNLRAEELPEIDHRVDEKMQQIARRGGRLVLDSRMAWHLVPGAFKVYLTVDLDEAARRVLDRDDSTIDEYRSVDDARTSILAREQSERTRFSRLYGVDVARFDNYDLVVDTTHASPHDVCAVIAAALDVGSGSTDAHCTRLFLDPKRLLPTEQLRGVAPESGDGPGSGGERRAPIDVCLANGVFAVVDGHGRLSRSLRNGDTLIEARLVAQDEEEVRDGLTARQYLAEELTIEKIHQWESAHGFRFSAYPHGLDSVDHPDAAGGGPAAE